jgi:hypothetical protein
MNKLFSFLIFLSITVPALATAKLKFSNVIFPINLNTILIVTILLIQINNQNILYICFKSYP